MKRDVSVMENLALNYDKVVRKKIEAETINYGIISGNEKIVFIKVGADGNIKGYKNKYLKMAHRVHEKTGATVICASNPYTETEQISSDKTPGSIRQTASATANAGNSPPVSTKSPIEISSSTISSITRWSMPS